MYKLKPTSNKSFLFESRWGKGLSVFLILAIIIVGLNVWSPARSLVAQILSPFWSAGGYFYNIANFIPKYFGDKNKILKENEMLLGELENARASAIDTGVIKTENEELRNELKLRPEGELFSARVISRPPQIPQDTLFIDKGTGHGITKDSLVLGSSRVLIGRVDATSVDISTIVLNSFPGTLSYGFVDRTLESVEVAGLGGGGMQAKVPLDFDIKVGDKIMFEGTTTYILGVVAVIEENTSSGFKNILISLPLTISKIHTVFLKSN